VERFSDILAAQRAAYLRDGAPSLAARRSDLKKFKAALLTRQTAIEEAINTDFGNRWRHETALLEVFGVVQGIDYLERNLRRFMRPSRRHRPELAFRQQPHRVPAAQSSRRHLTVELPVNLSLMPVVTVIAQATACSNRRSSARDERRARVDDQRDLP
jgi:coniferyl-aldehyde dehydrogenase